MGTWGAALYSGDFAMDLRATIGAVVRLPFDPDRLVDILCETETAAAHDPHNEDHTTFWLILADQFVKRGMSSDRVRETALGIIAAADDIAMLEQRGMKPADMRKRRRLLDELRARIVATPVDKPRTVLKKPQPLLMDRGDVIVYPTCDGRCINPYLGSKELNTRYTKDGPAPWMQDGWAAAVIIDCGRAFDFLSWYRSLTIASARPQKPTLDSLRGDVVWRLELPGTCSPTHFNRMELEKIGTLPVDPERVRSVFPGLRPGISAAVSDISIANRLSAAPDAGSDRIAKPVELLKGRARGITRIEQILSDSA
jgi:hypothetical protein